MTAPSPDSCWTGWSGSSFTFYMIAAPMLVVYSVSTHWYLFVLLPYPGATINIFLNFSQKGPKSPFHLPLVITIIPPFCMLFVMSLLRHRCICMISDNNLWDFGIISTNQSVFKLQGLLVLNFLEISCQGICT